MFARPFIRLPEMLCQRTHRIIHALLFHPRPTRSAAATGAVEQNPCALYRQRRIIDVVQMQNEPQSKLGIGLKKRKTGNQENNNSVTKVIK